MSEHKFKLTIARECCNPECRAPLFKELMVSWDDELCFECAPPREELPTAFRMMAAPFETDGYHASHGLMRKFYRLTGEPSLNPVCNAECCRGWNDERPFVL